MRQRWRAPLRERARGREPWRAHAAGWVALWLIAFLQPPGEVAADTKFDLVANPARFLARATHAYTDEFPLGQVQNQAYGYLFPQGAFFLATSPLPDWVQQRLWWALLLCVAYSGALVLARRVGMRGVGPVVAAGLYALSPRILTTLTAISSEAWPVALVPWTLVPLVARRPQVAPSIVAVFCMGAVNATATIAACLPAALWLIARREPLKAAQFTLGAAAVSAWWIGPLLVLGRYSPPFTEFIESAAVTTAWLNPVEILRGTTSWAPFVETERVAGHLLVSGPAFIIATSLVAAFGLAGLARRDMPWRGPLLVVFSVGFALLASAHMHASLYDATLAPFRNLHKFDPLVRLPLVLGAGWLASKVRAPQLTAVLLAAVVAVAPAWSLRLLPQGTWREVSPDWVAAGQWLDEHASHTRTLVVPAVPFPRQDWGWTRDEPIQALTGTRFAFRDAIPLVDPEAIRGLDGQVEAIDAEALRSIGVGAVLVRGDVDKQKPDLGKPTATFGDINIYLLEPARDMMLADTPLLIDGAGETLPLLWRELGYFPAVLASSDGGQIDIVTDTPALAARNYGDGRQSAHVQHDFEAADQVGNRLYDYPSAGRDVAVRADLPARASSSWADATAFGGAQPSKSLTAAFDGLDDTAWWPAPGDPEPWIAFEPDGDTVTITATDDTTVALSNGDTRREISLVGGQPRTVRNDSYQWLYLTEPVGIAELSGGSRIVEVEGTADTYFFQRLFPETDVLQRRFTVAEGGKFTLSSPALIDGTKRSGTTFLSAGPHEVVTDAETLLITRGVPELPAWSPVGVGGGDDGEGDGGVGGSVGDVTAAEHDRLLLTTRAFNSGLRASVGGVELAPTRVDAGAQAFEVPAGVGGEVRVWFTGEDAYRYSLLFGGAFSLLVAAWCLWVPWRRFERWEPAAPARLVGLLPAVPAVAAVAASPLWGTLAVGLAWAVRRFTALPARWLAGAAMAASGLALARAPWPAADYAGSSAFTVAACLFAVACLSWPDGANRRTNSVQVDKRAG
ncbi:alpha-(1-_3)-arabinofuranosyltransferase family protein [Corynebacterium sp. Marseille-P4321]|uniref:alpha-(1->3)-arabinofuranosyltransferase domain-containing protein n=1 Tax=Corynebacterium sp. Marseille-P4321 TaxID=2736603 RepID=UPI001589EEA7|nr:alpha-(1->3)-arabinofuranosyltransferase family protein [Corynebacterium sp. Marseille-P4321]